jgi:hypothetical protein
VSTIRLRGVRFHFFPQDHEPRHAHAEYGETTAVVEFTDLREARISSGSSAVFATAKRSDVRQILDVATEYFDVLIAAWENMHA